MNHSAQQWLVAQCLQSFFADSRPYRINCSDFFSGLGHDTSFSGIAILLQIDSFLKTQWLMAVIPKMNKNQLDKYRERLNGMLRDVERQNARGQEGQRTVMLDQQSVGRLSRMDALQQQEMAKATQMRRDQLKTRIDSALARIDEEESGYCVQCGDEIAAPRLENDPAVPTCLSCASR
ncbi:MAG: TraR/DksA family transcriptional regulator [Paracoccaceae bacterium]